MNIRFNRSVDEKVVKAKVSGTEIAVVIPTLNEKEAVGKVLDGVKNVMDGYDYRMVVVDGRSVDGTDEIARSRDADVIYQRGRGYGDALKTGFSYARKLLDARVVVMMDADLTYDPNDIPELVGPILKDEADLVVGNRFDCMEKGAMPFVNKVGNRVLSWVARSALGLSIRDTQCGMRAFRSELVDSMDMVTEGMPFAIEMLAEAKFADARISEAPVSYRSRVGKTKLSPMRDGVRILGTTLRLMRDTQPLLFFGGIGTFLGVVGILLGVDVTLDWIRTRTVGRLPTVMLSVLLILGAMQFFAIGLVADMIKGLRRRK